MKTPNPTPPHRRKRQAGAPDKRRLLLVAAFEEVAERGFSAVTLEDIAERAGVSKGVTLYYFESKEELFRTLFAWVTERLHDRMRAVLEKPTALEQLHALNDVIVASSEKNRAFYAVFLDFSSLTVRHESFRLVNAAFYEGCTEVERAIAQKGIAEGTFPPQDVDRAVLLLRSLFDGLMLRWLSEKDPDTAFACYRASCMEQALTILSARTHPERRDDHEKRPRGSRPQPRPGAAAPPVPSPRLHPLAPADLGDDRAAVRSVRAGARPVRPQRPVEKARR